MVDASGADEAGGHDLRPVELRREANTMALYVAICLLAALTALPDTGDSHAHLLGIIWGVTTGLAVAHWLAFRVATRLVSAGRFHREDVELAAAQLVGSVAVAVLASVPVLVLPESVELGVAEAALALFVAAVGFAAMRGGGASRRAALVYSVVVLVAALAVVFLKNWLAGH